MQFLLVSAGCAECFGWDQLLIEAKVFSTLEAAKENSWLHSSEWKDHPQGGWYAHSGQGDDWVIEVPDGIILKEINKE